MSNKNAVPPNAVLSVLSGPLQGRNLPLTRRELSLGRDIGCDIVLEGYTRVSRRHARLSWDGKQFSISDAGSTNGVRINHQKVQTQVLLPGQTLELGDFAARLWLPPTPDKTKFGRAPAEWAAIAVGVVVLVASLGVWRAQTSPPMGDSRSGENGKNGRSVPRVAAGSETSSVAPSGEGKISAVAIENGKAATVLIAHEEGSSVSFGSGFVVGGGRILTNRHVVVNDAGNPVDCLLVFRSGTREETKMPVSGGQIRLAPRAQDNNEFTDDLAIIDLNQTLVSGLPLGQPETLTETDTLYAFGFPLGVGTLTLDNQLPSVSVKAVSVERLQRGTIGGHDAVTVLQLGGSITHGNSGGPVLNNRGEVVGVVALGAENTSMSFAIPIGFVKQLLN